MVLVTVLPRRFFLAFILPHHPLRVTHYHGSWLAAIGGIFVFIFLAGRLRYSWLLLLLVVALGFTAFIAFPSHVPVKLCHPKDHAHLSLHLVSWQQAAGCLQAFPRFRDD